MARNRRLSGMVRTALLAATVLASMAPASADPLFDRFVSFGDSYADPVRNIVPLVLGLPFGYPSQGASPSSIAATQPWVAYPYWMQSQLGLADGQVTSYAIAGSTTSPFNVIGVPYSLPYQVAAWGGRPFGPDDLVALSIGGNDGLVMSGSLRDSYPFHPDGTAFDATQATLVGGIVSSVASATVNLFASAGARTIVLPSFSDLSGIPATASSPNRASLAIYGQTLFAGLQLQLRPLALSGTRIFLIDVAALGRQVGANLAAYGFGAYEYAGPAGPLSLFRSDDVHLTSQGFEVMAGYITSALTAPYAFGAAPQAAQSAAASLTTSLLQRLDAGRSGTAAWDEAVGRPFTVYALGTFTGAGDDPTGQDGHGGGGTLGVEAHLAPGLLGGLALNYTRRDGDDGRGGEIEADLLQGAAYLSYADGGFFGDALVGYGGGDFELDRRGVLYPAAGETDGDAFTAAARGGYLFDLGGARLGPVAGIRLVRANVDGFTETGDPLLAFRVEDQTMETTTGELGVQVRTAFELGGRPAEGFVNLAWQHEFGDPTRVQTATLLQSPLLPITTQIDNFGRRDYGTIGGGISLRLSDRASAMLTGSSTFARDGGDIHQIDAGIGFSF